MARKFTLGGKAPQNGYRVSHSHRRTKHLWMPNIQTKTLFSTTLGRPVRLTISTRELRTVDRAGGLDSYLLQADPEALSTTMRNLQSQIRQRSGGEV